MNAIDYALLDLVETPVFVVEMQGDERPVYVAWNRAASEMSGLSAAQVIGKTAKELHPGRLGEIAHRRHCRVAAEKRSATYQLTLPLGGRQTRVQTHLCPVLDDDGNVANMVATVTDVTARQGVAEAQSELNNFASEVEDFISLAAHDLRAPLRNVQTVADLLREDFVDLGDGKLELIDMLGAVGTKAMALISDILAHAQATGATAQVAEFDLRDLCEGILLVLDPFQNHAVACPDIEIEADRNLVQIAIRNLMDNAFKHAGRDHVQIEIGVAEAEDGLIEVTLSDNGKGFGDPAMAFIRSGKLRVDSGFGLLGVRRMLTAAGGRLSAGAPQSGTGGIVRFALRGRLRTAAPPAQAAMA